jgi:ferritin-like protein
MVIPGDTSAIIVTQTRKDERGYEIAEDLRTVSIAHMTEFSDLPSKRNGRRKKAQ